MKKLLTVAALMVGLGLLASAHPGHGSDCCQQKGLRAGWFTGAGTVAQAGQNSKAEGKCCKDGKAEGKCCKDGKAEGKCCKDGKAEGKCCKGDKADNKAQDKCCKDEKANVKADDCCKGGTK